MVTRAGRRPGIRAGAGRAGVVREAARLAAVAVLGQVLRSALTVAVVAAVVWLVAPRVMDRVASSVTSSVTSVVDDRVSSSGIGQVQDSATRWWGRLSRQAGRMAEQTGGAR